MAKLYGGSKTSRYATDRRVLGIVADVNARSQSPGHYKNAADLVSHTRDNSNELSRSFRLTSKLSKWSEHNEIVVQAAVGGGGDAYGKAMAHMIDKKKFNFYDNRPHFSQKRL